MFGVKYQEIKYNVKINKENKIELSIQGIMDKKRYTSKRYHPKLSDCNVIRNKLFVNKYGYSFLRQSLNNVVNEEREIGMDGTFTYEFDIQTNAGYEIKVDVDAITGNIEEANFELYEIGLEKE